MRSIQILFQCLVVVFWVVVALFAALATIAILLGRRLRQMQPPEERVWHPPQTLKELCDLQDKRVRLRLSSPAEQKRITLEIESVIYSLKRFGYSREMALNMPFAIMPPIVGGKAFGLVESLID